MPFSGSVISEKSSLWNGALLAQKIALLGAVIQLTAGLAVAYMDHQAWPWMTIIMGNPHMLGAFNMMGFSRTWIGYTTWAVTVILLVGISFVGVLLIGSRSRNYVKLGAVILIIVSVLSSPTMWGLVIGSMLMFLAGSLGIAQTYSVEREL